MCNIMGIYYSFDKLFNYENIAKMLNINETAQHEDLFTSKFQDIKCVV